MALCLSCIHLGFDADTHLDRWRSFQGIPSYMECPIQLQSGSVLLDIHDQLYFVLLN
jgi:hypothetical protein